MSTSTGYSIVHHITGDPDPSKESQMPLAFRCAMCMIHAQSRAPGCIVPVPQEPRTVSFERTELLRRPGQARRAAGQAGPWNCACSRSPKTRSTPAAVRQRRASDHPRPLGVSLPHGGDAAGITLEPLVLRGILAVEGCRDGRGERSGGDATAQIAEGRVVRRAGLRHRHARADGKVDHARYAACLTAQRLAAGKAVPGSVWSHGASKGEGGAEAGRVGRLGGGGGSGGRS